MIWLALVMSTLCTVLLAWHLQARLLPALRRYRELYTKDTRMRLGEIFLFVDPASLLMWALLLSVALATGVFAVTGSVGLSLLAMVAGFRMPSYVMTRLRNRRKMRFQVQLPLALLQLAGALKAGAGMSAALRHITEHSEAPLSQEFALVLREQRLGVTLEAALEHLRERMPSEASALMVSAIRVALRTGGNLAETLEQVATTLRDRLQLQGKIRALTSQGRMQAWILGVLPLLLLGVLSYLDPDAMAVLWTRPSGWIALGAIGGLEFAGVLWIHRIIDIDI